MTTQASSSSRWTQLPVWLRAILAGLLIALPAANLWPVLLLSLGVPLAAVLEVLFLALYLWWAGGGGPPRTTQATRATSFRRRALSAREWGWAVVAALFFAATIQASLVLLFRLVPFPLAAFRQGNSLSFIPSVSLKWLAVVLAASSAGICEETGFRGYLQRPIEQRYGAFVAILLSSFFFMGVHLNQAWARPELLPIIFGAGALLGLLAWSSGSLIPGMMGHVLMDIGLFAYWWTGIAGDFTARTLTETGMDEPFLIACLAFAVSLCVVLLAIIKLGRRSPLLP